MSRVSRSTPLFLGVLLVALLAAGFAAQHYRLFDRTWFNLSLLWQPANPNAINRITREWEGYNDGGFSQNFNRLFPGKADGTAQEQHAYRMWNNLWKSLPVAETPIAHVTNGIHVPSYVGSWMNELLRQYLGSGWMQAPPGSGVWDKVDQIPDEAYWAARMHQKEALLDELRRRIPEFIQDRKSVV